MYHKSDWISNIPYTKKYSGTFRATKIWNDIAEIFSENVPRRIHRRHLKFYHDCFPASAAVDVVHEILKRNENISGHVKREQVGLWLLAVTFEQEIRSKNQN